MKNLAHVFLLLAPALLAGCHGVSNDLAPLVEISAINLPAELVGGAEGEFTCDFEAGAGAATLSWDFGGGASPNSGGPAPEGGQATATVTFVEVTEPTEFTLTVELKDNTNPNRHDSMSVGFTVAPPPPPA